jgi:hypothetical protein
MKCSLCDDDFSKELEQKMEECLSVPDPIPPQTLEEFRAALKDAREHLGDGGHIHVPIEMADGLVELAAGYKAERDEARDALRELIDADDGNEMPSPRMSAAWRNALRVLGESTDAKS